MRRVYLSVLATSALVLAWLANPAYGAVDASAAQRQDLGALRQKAEAFLLTHSMGYPGEVKVAVGAIDPNLKLAHCPSADVFMPTGSRAWGKTSIGVRCASPAVWTIYVQANVSVMADYLIAATPLVQGRVVTSQDLAFARGDLTRLPPGIFTDMAQAVGQSVGISLMAGAVLRQDMLKALPAVQQGQTVLVTTNGKGFRISAEGRAMTTAGEGQIVRVKVASGEVISGVARAGGQVEVAY